MRKLSFVMGDDAVKYSTIAYYCTENGKVKGTLEVSQTRIFFDPLKCDENSEFKSLKPYKVVIDMSDVISTSTKKLINDTIKYVHDPSMKPSYMFDFFIQIDLKDVNRVAIKNKEN